MSTAEIVPVSQVEHDLDIQREGIAKASLDAWLSDLSPNSRRAYRRDLRAFSDFYSQRKGASFDTWGALFDFLGCDFTAATIICTAWKRAMIEAGLAPKSVNRRLSALRQAVQCSNLVEWRLSIKGLKARPYRDTKGPGVDRLQTMMGAARMQRNHLKALRDAALLRLMFDAGLRRGEVTALDVGDLDAERGSISILGKGRVEKEAHPVLTEQALEAVAEYLEAREGAKGGPVEATDPLFVRITAQGDTGGRLTAGGIYHVIQDLARQAGVGRVHPHGLRHTSVSAYLKESKGDLWGAQTFARHKSITTTKCYDDSGSEAARVASRKVASLLT